MLIASDFKQVFGRFNGTLRDQRDRHHHQRSVRVRGRSVREVVMGRRQAPQVNTAPDSARVAPRASNRRSPNRVDRRPPPFDAAPDSNRENRPGGRCGRAGDPRRGPESSAGPGSLSAGWPASAGTSRPRRRRSARRCGCGSGPRLAGWNGEGAVEVQLSAEAVAEHCVELRGR